MKPRRVEVEVVGKDEPRITRNDDPFVALVSRLMDNVFTVPGTNIRFGLDPLLGLIPGLGDTLSAAVSTILILQSARHGVPKIILARMAMNVLLNTGVGAVPVLGDLFSVWFRSNERNYNLLRAHGGARKSAGVGDWLFVFGLLAAVLLVLALLIAGAWTLLSALFGSGAGA